jgi:two-component system cell cycle sensor histidine kinase/response regulator CckA
MAKKILVVDDNQMLVRYLTHLLEKEGHEVRAAGDGFQALELLSDYRPEILFLDLIMPRIGGDKLCRIVRQMKGFEDSYVVIVSAAASEMDFDFAAIGANACIAKGPFGAMGKHVLAAVKSADVPQPNGQPVAIVGIENVYNRRLTRELLSHSRHFEAVLESIDEGILEVYSQKIVYANSAAVLLFGLPIERLLTAYPPDLFDPSVRPKIEALIAEQPVAPTQIGRSEPADLNGRLVTIRRLPLKGEEQTIILMINDITDQVELEMQLQHAQKMEAIGTIASGVAHNFRNTLAGIMMNSQVLQVRYPADSNLQEIARRINASVRRGAGLVDGLLQFSRKQIKREFSQTDLVELVNDVVDLARQSFDRRITLSVTGPESLELVADPPGLSQALMNICNNARDAMPTGGQLTIDLKTEADTAVITVTDSGSGMDAEALSKCFDPFYTTKEVGKGTGLGLSTTYGIVKGHEGNINVSSEPGKGTAVSISLPVIRGDLESDPGSSLKLVFGKGEKVLVVDDEKEFTEAMPDLLRSLGYRVSIADTPAEAIASFETWRPDLVLMDLNMPDVDGLTCAEKMWALDPAARILAITGYDDDAVSPQQRQRLKGFVTKPIDLGELSRILADVLKE